MSMDVLTSSAQALAVRLGGCSVAGVKEINQDAFAAKHPTDAHTLTHKGVVLAIADGVSSSAISQQASQMAVQEFIDEYYSTPVTWSVEASAAKVLRSLNNWFYAQNVASRASSENDADGMVTTFTAVIIKSCTAYICHTGDSRLYLLRDGNLQQLTRDHSRRYAGGFVLTAALGADQHLDVDFRKEALEQGDCLLLSTDGFHAVEKHAEFNQKINSAVAAAIDAGALEQASKLLVHAALEAGSDDNISCLFGVVDSLPTETLDEALERLTRLRIPPVLSPATKIDGMEVLSVLHNSTRSHLYRVRRLQDGAELVLKAPSRNFQDDAIYLDGFVREQWLGQQLDHPSVMKTLPRPPDSPFMYMLCEFVPGKTLRQWMLDNPLPALEQVRDIASQIVAGLRVLQRAGIVHRDLKPENIMVHENGCTLIDYGTAQVRGLNELASVLIEEVPVGSVNYIAPEYLLGGEATTQSDLFSLGCVVYEMLVGKLPFKMDDSRLKQPKNTQAWQYRPARRYRQGVPYWLELALQKATAPDPLHRYDAYSEFLKDIYKPGAVALKKLRRAPLIERYPQRFWQVTSALLVLLVLLQWAYIASS